MLHNNKITKKLVGFLALTALVVAGLATFFPLTYQVSAGMNLCSSLGPGLDVQNSANLDPIFANAEGRKWTAEELFRGAVKFTSYIGEGEETWLLAGTDPDRGARSSLWEDETVQANLTSVTLRSIDRCVLGGVPNWGPNLLLSMASGFTNISSAASSALFNENFICTDSDTSNCSINILGTIGGDGGANTGLIGSFTNAIYFPLVILAFLAVALHLIYRGIIQRQFRSALFDIVWSVLALVFGIALLMNPAMLAQAPQNAANVLSTCLIAGMNGENCLTDSNSGELAISSMIGTECVSSMSGQSSADTFSNGLSCGIWKTFVLNSWANTQFGAPYNELYTANVPEGGQLWAMLPEGEGDNYCVTLGSSGSASSFKGTYITLDSASADDVVCNVALYQLYLMTNAHDTVNHDGDGGKVTNPGLSYDERWFDIITPIAVDQGQLRGWSGYLQGFSRLSASMTAFLSAVMASGLIIVLAMFGLIYKVAGTVLMVFAPFFFLLAIHPGKGKKIFLGWVESILSSLMKFFMSALLVIVALALYAAVVGQTSPVKAFLGALLITALLFVYRKELINLLGNVNMGGQRIANKLGDTMGKKAKQFGTAMAGGAIGELAAKGMHKEATQFDADGNPINNTMLKALFRKNYKGPAFDEDGNEIQKDLASRMKRGVKDFATNTGKNISSAVTGAAEGATREATRGRGVGAQVARQYNRASHRLENEDTKRQAQAAANAKKRKNRADEEQTVKLQDGIDKSFNEKFKGVSDNDLAERIQDVVNKGVSELNEDTTKELTEMLQERSERLGDKSNMQAFANPLSQLEIPNDTVNLDSKSITRDNKSFLYDNKFDNVSDKELAQLFKSRVDEGKVHDGFIDIATEYYKRSSDKDDNEVTINEKVNESIVQTSMNSIDYDKYIEKVTEQSNKIAGNESHAKLVQIAAKANNEAADNKMIDDSIIAEVQLHSRLDGADNEVLIEKVKVLEERKLRNSLKNPEEATLQSINAGDYTKSTSKVHSPEDFPISRDKLEDAPSVHKEKIIPTPPPLTEPNDSNKEDGAPMKQSLRGSIKKK